MKENFEKALSFVLSCEGGYENDPNDPGGETFKGISRRSNPSWGGWIIIDDYKNAVGKFPVNALLDKELNLMVIQVYKKHYWDELNLNSVDYPWDIILMDTGVNIGCTAAKQLFAKSQNWLDFLMYRIEYYSRLPGAKHYLRGWVNRVIKLCNLIRSELKHDII